MTLLVVSLPIMVLAIAIAVVPLAVMIRRTQRPVALAGSAGVTPKVHDFEEERERAEVAA